MQETPATTLAGHFSTLDFDAIPAVEVAKMKRLVLDWFGVAISGSQTESGRIAAEFSALTGGVEDATLIGRGGRVPATNAAFANAIASHSIELDDVDVLALFHFSPPVVSAGLAAAERVKANGRTLLAGLIAGSEVMARASNATNFSLRNRGFHTTPTCGVFGATIAATRISGLSVDQTVSALGLAGAQAAGLMEMYGPSMQKRFNPGPAARGGLTATMMAELGFTGAATIFEGRYGFCQAYSDEYDVARLTENLDSYHLEIEHKPHSCARPIHNAIDCALGIAQQLREPVSAIKSIVVRRHPQWASYHLNRAPSTYHEAQMSLPYSVAIALVEGGALPSQYQNAKLRDPELTRLAGMVEVVPDETLPRGVSCHMTITTTGGQEASLQVDYPLGSIENPMSDEAMARKFHLLSDPVIGQRAARRLAEAIGALEQVDDIGEMMQLAVARS